MPVGLGQYEEAIADYDQAIRLQPDFASFYFSRGHARVELGQYEEAIADYDQTIRLQPDQAHFYINRSNAKTKLGQHQEAIADLQAALELAREAGDNDRIVFIEGKIEELEQEE